MKKSGDTTPEPEGGRAAERLRMFAEARGTMTDHPLPPTETCADTSATDGTPAHGTPCGKPAVGYVVTRWNNRYSAFCLQHLDECRLTAQMLDGYEWDIIDADGTRTSYGTAPPPADTVWEGILDNRYHARVVRTGTGTGTLILVDHSDGDRELLSEPVVLSYGAQWGPDVQDVADWQDRIEGFLAAHEAAEGKHTTGEGHS